MFDRLANSDSNMLFSQPARNMTCNPMQGTETSHNVATGSSVCNRPNPQAQHHSETDLSSISANTTTQSSMASPAFSQFTPPEAPDIESSNNSNMETNRESGIYVLAPKNSFFTVDLICRKSFDCQMMSNFDAIVICFYRDRSIMSYILPPL